MSHGACQIVRTNVEVSPLELRSTSSFCLNMLIVLVVVLFETFTFSALSIQANNIAFNRPCVPRIVPVMPWPRVLLMNPRGRTCETNLPSALNEIVSFMSPTVPCQSPDYSCCTIVPPRWCHRQRAQDGRLNRDDSYQQLKRSIFDRQVRHLR